MAQVLDVSVEPRQGFERRLFEAASTEWKRQIADDFEMLKCIPSLYARTFMAFISSVERNQRFACVQSLMKKQLSALDPRLPGLVSESLSDEDERVFGHYKEWILNATDFVRQAKEARAAKRGSRLSEIAIMKTAEAVIRDVWPEASRVSSERGEVVYEQIRRDWLVWTVITATPATAGFAYQHVVRTREGLLLRPPISYLSWLGLCGATTEWVKIDKSSIDTASSLFRELLTALGSVILAALSEGGSAPTLKI